MLQRTADLTSQYINLRNPVDLIPEKFDTDRRIRAVCREHFQHITVHTERTSLKVHVISCILHIDQCTHHIIPVSLHPRTQRHTHAFPLIRTSKSVNTGNRSHNDDILPLGQSRRRRKAQLIDLIIDGRILRNIGIRLRYISFRLIIVVVGYEIFYRIFREKFLHLSIKLSSKRLIMGNDQSRLVQRLNDVRHSKRLAGTGDAKKRLKLIAFFESFYQLFDCLRLIAGRLIF